MNTTYRARQDDRGVALLTALALLFLFSLLGAAYVGYMTNEVERTDFAIRGVRARNMARGGVHTAIGAIRQAIDENRLPDLLASPFDVELPVYKSQPDAPLGFGVRGNQRAVTRVAVYDESGKVNINHAPPRVLQAVLGVDGDTARRIRSSLPSAGASGGQWFGGLEGLVHRGFLSRDAFDALDNDLVTVYTVFDHARPAASLNVNAAREAVLGAIMDLSPEARAAIGEQRPIFKAPAELAAVAGKQTSTFNFKPKPGSAPNALAEELCFDSRCFRIVSTATVSNVGPNDTEYRKTQARVEAVVVLAPGGVQVTYWSEAPERAGA